MKISKKNKAYVAVLGVALGSLGIDLTFFGSPSARAMPAAEGLPAADNAPVRTPVTGAIAPMAVAPVGLPLSARLRSLTASGPGDLADLREAFATSAGWLNAPPPAAQEQKDPSAALLFQTDHKLVAVILSAGGGQAIINDKFVRVGQTIDGFKLASVRRGSASFTCGSNQVELLIGPAGPIGNDRKSN